MANFPLTIWNQDSSLATNETYSFRVRLDNPLNLELDKWEVALYEMIYPNRLLQRIDSSTIFLSIIIDHYDNILQLYSLKCDLTIEINASSYWNNEALINHIRDVVQTELIKCYQRESNHSYLSQLGILPKFEWDIKLTNGKYSLGSISQVVEFESNNQSIRKCDMTITNGIQMWKLLGFSNFKLDTIVNLGTISSNAHEKPNFDFDLSGFFIKAPNLITSNTVGFSSGSAPILAYVPFLNNDKEENISIQFKHPIFISITGGYINNIQIEIQDLYFKPINFQSNTLKLVLLFRLKNKQW